MSPKQYKELIKRTDYNDETLVERFIPRLQDPLTAKLVHYTLGLGGEAGELLDAVKKSIRDGKAIDRVNLVEEAGDCLWYLTNLLSALDSSLEEAMQMNITKLNKRYPTGFTEEAGINRNVAEERKAMEGFNEDTN
jgi:NTP pyrophosphatase (non-canonical NTP hydrolase)